MKNRASLLTFTAWLAFLGWGTLLCYLSSLSGAQIQLPRFFAHEDKVIHAGYFLVGGFLLAWAVWRTWRLRGWRLVVIVAGTLAMVGILDEVHQLSTYGRSGGDKGDWVADCAGGTAGAILFSWFYGKAGYRRPPSASELAPQGDRAA